MKTTRHRFPAPEGRKRAVVIQVTEHDGYCIGRHVSNRGRDCIFGEATPFGPEAAAASAFYAYLDVKGITQ